MAKFNYRLQNILNLMENFEEQAKQAFAERRKILNDEEDKLAVYRARKIQKFLSQPFNVAENFTGLKGKYVPLKDTIEGFRAIIDGEMDKYPEAAFLMAGTIDDVIHKAKQIGDDQ